MRYPTQDEKEYARVEVMRTMSERLDKKYRPAVMAGGFSMIDSTLCQLYRKPGYHGAVFRDRNKDFSMTVHVCSIRPIPTVCRLILIAALLTGSEDPLYA